MGFTKLIPWRRIELPQSYWKILSAANPDNKSIVLGVYTNKESSDDGDAPLYTPEIIVDDVSFAELFSETSLKQEGVTAKSQSYVYVRSLEEYSEATDILEDADALEVPEVTEVPENPEIVETTVVD